MDWRSRALGGIERRSHTLSIDLGTYCGEVAIRCVPQHGWVTDETRYKRRTVMETGGRVVIGHNSAALPKTITIRVDAHAIAAFGTFADRPLPQVKEPTVLIIAHSFRPLPMDFTPEGSPRQGHHLR
jgi:hypothetical protein